MVILALAIAWVGFHANALVSLLHLSSESPKALLDFLHFFYGHKLLFVAAPLVVAGFMTFMAWSWWSISYFKVDSYGLTYEMGPFIKNTIPLRAIQDIRVSRSLLGIFMGYGTLVVDAGREEEALLLVPHVNDFMNALRPGALR